MVWYLYGMGTVWYGICGKEAVWYGICMVWELMLWHLWHGICMVWELYGMTSVRYGRCMVWELCGMGAVCNDICMVWELYGMASVWYRALCNNNAELGHSLLKMLLHLTE